MILRLSSHLLSNCFTDARASVCLSVATALICVVLYVTTSITQRLLLLIFIWNQIHAGNQCIPMGISHGRGHVEYCQSLATSTASRKYSYLTYTILLWSILRTRQSWACLVSTKRGKQVKVMKNSYPLIIEHVTKCQKVREVTVPIKLKTES